jgi:hypothetical protein
MGIPSRHVKAIGLRLEREEDVGDRLGEWEFGEVETRKAGQY